MMKFNAFGTSLKMLAKKNMVSTGTTKNMLVKTLGFLEFSLKPRDFIAVPGGWLDEFRCLGATTARGMPFGTSGTVSH